jgi:glycosyltransferase involved in cell wall biosynthesis
VKVVVYPADVYGCGHHRLIWPAEELRRAGHDVTVVTQRDRMLRMHLDERDDEVKHVELAADVDVVVFQRTTHRYVAQAVQVIRDQGITVVVDVDDDLASVHPSNPAWRDLHPHRERYVKSVEPHMHSWHNLALACRTATLVTTTTPTLVRRYAGHGRGVVLPNYLAEHYYDVAHVDSDVLGWPAALRSHPDDPSVVGNAVARLVAEGARFTVTSVDPGVEAAFGLHGDDARVERPAEAIDLLEWPRVLGHLGVGIAPLADTRFNAAKSWLKPLELAAVGVPWVASPRAEYQRLHRLGCGVLVDKPRDWYRVLRQLLNDPGRRVELSERGRAVAETLRLRDHAWRWWDAWTRARELDVDAGVLVAGRGS